MLAQRLDPVEAFRQRNSQGSPVYRQRLKRRGLSIHARFVAEATQVFPDAMIIENIPHPMNRLGADHENS